VDHLNTIQFVRKTVSSQEFLENYEQILTGSCILEGEAALIDSRFEELKQQQQRIVDQKREVAEQSGDNWHDGAFNATDNAAKIVSNQALALIKMREGLLVREPDSELLVVSLGSAVTVELAGTQFVLILVGHSSLFTESSAHEFCSIASPIARALIGKSVGDFIPVTLDARQLVYEIKKIDQEKIRQLLPR
jgi:transcription elongation GreA/GreB family factor